MEFMNPADALPTRHEGLPWPPSDGHYQKESVAGSLDPKTDTLNPVPDTTYTNLGDYVVQLVDASDIPSLEYNNTTKQPLDTRVGAKMHNFLKDTYFPQLKKRFNGRVTAKMSSAYRPLEEQKKLYEAGSTKTLNSEHLAGDAADLQMYDNGKWMYGSNYDNDSLFNEVINFNDSIANANDMFYGKNYEGFKDYPHFALNKTLHDAKKGLENKKDRQALGRAIRANKEEQRKLDEKLRLKAQFEELNRRRADTIPSLRARSASIASLSEDINNSIPK
jgi:hypothetical protein